MVQIEDSIKKTIMLNLENILNIQDKNWNLIDNNIKIKIIHHYCNFLSDNNKLSDNFIDIPLKSIKPKKLIQFSGINKMNNKHLFNIYNSQVLEYTFKFRENFLNKKRKYYVFSNMPKLLHDSILQDYTKIIYNFIIDNLSNIKTINFYEGLIGNNKDKLVINSLPKSFKISCLNSNLKIEFDNNIQIICELIFSSDKITNNIPVKLIIKLINIF